MSTVISFERVSKKFTLHRQRARSFQELALSLFRRDDDILSGSTELDVLSEDGSREDFWALKDVSFTVEQGEAVGLIGPNGAGKSTALKLISRIIAPTSGRIEVNGRLGALLELGAGFHPDLTGRENVYLNGSILGLNRSQIEWKLDEIIAFAELERFIDVPVKHYSSGMYVRLGFSVAVHTDPDILLIDEVLAVGDQTFQQKCLQCIHKLKQKGMSIILVSHGLGDVASLCERVIWLQEGKIQASGSARVITDQYLVFSDEKYYRQQQVEQSIAKDVEKKEEEENRWGTFQAEITKVELLDVDGSSTLFFRTGDFFQLRIHYRTRTRIDEPAFGLAFYRRDGVHINGPNSVRENCGIAYIDGSGCVDYFIEHLPLNPGHYELTVAIYDRESITAYDHHHRLYSFEVRSSTLWCEEGVVHIPARWQHIPSGNLVELSKV